MNNTTSRITKAVKEGFGTDIQDTMGMDTVFTDIGADSMTIVSIALALEEEFAVEIPDSDFNKIQSLKAIKEYLSNHDVH